MTPVNDHIKLGLKVLFVGFNPSIRSSETGHHYANPNNRFWKILYESGLTDRQYLPSEGDSVFEMGYGFTNIVSRPTRSAEEITKEEYLRGKQVLKKKINKYRPKIACFVGKGVYLQYSGKRKADWGRQQDSIIPGVVDFVAPSTSGLVRMKTEDMVLIYKELNSLVQKI